MSSSAPDSSASESEHKTNATAKLLRVLEAVSEPPGAHRLSSLVASTGLAKTSVYRLLTELIANGYVTRDASGHYRPDTSLKVLAARVTANDDSKTIHELLTRLQDQVGNTIHFALRTGDKAVYIDKVEGSDQPIRMASRPGMELSLHSTAIGKAILAHLPEEEVRRYTASSGLPALTDNSITDVDALLADGSVVRERGYAIDDQENERYIRCIAAPILDHEGEPVGGISISTVTALVPLKQLRDFATPLISTANEVRMAFGR